MSSDPPPGLDPETGELRLDGVEVVIGPRHGPGAIDGHRVEGTIAGVPFLALLEFREDHLSAIRLTAADPAIGGTSWEDYDPATARAFHDAWLASELGHAGTPWHGDRFPLGGVEYGFPWGTVGSYLHPQDMGAVIVIRYGSP